MASGRIAIPVGLETRDVAKGAKDAEKALEKLEDAVADTGKGGAKDLDKIEDELKDVQRESKKAEKAVGDVGEKGFSGASGFSGEFKDEAVANFSEVTSSFDGSMSSIQDLAQGTLGGLATSGIPGIGIAAGIAAAGVGLIGSELIRQQEEADELKERLSSAYQEAAAQGLAYLDTAQLIANANDLMFNKDRADEWKQVQADAKGLGLDLNDVINANAGDQESIRKVQERINVLYDDANAKSGDLLTSTSDQQETLLDIKHRWEDVSTATQGAIDTATALNDYVKKTEENKRSENRKTREELEALWKPPINTTVKVNVDASSFEELQRQVNRGLNLPLNAQFKWD